VTVINLVLQLIIQYLANDLSKRASE
jgi:hypothetical protein